MKKIKAQGVILPVLLGIVFIALMQLQIIHGIFGIKTLQLPLPFDIAAAFAENAAKIMENSITTIMPALGGMLLGAAIGYGIALLVTSFPTWGYGGLFVMTMINSIPIVALAPLMNRWFETPFISKLVVVTVASAGGMAVNAFHGLNDLSDNALDFMKANAASRGEIFRKLRIPNSLPSIFTAFKIIVPAAMLATIISEFFSSETSGLGYMIKHSLKVGNQKQIGWAYIAAVSILSILIYAVVCAMEKHFIRWHVSQRREREK